MTQDEFLNLALRNPANKIIAEKLFELALPDAWIVSGCLVQTVWNVLTGREVDYGINDYDVFYFDPDTSWAAEDAVIRSLHGALGNLDVKVEARNQARVHLWYGEKHGLPYPPLRCSTEGIDRFLTQEYADRHPPHARWLRRLCARWIRRCRRPDRAAQSGPEFFARRVMRRRRRGGRSCGRRSRCWRRSNDSIVVPANAGTHSHGRSWLRKSSSSAVAIRLPWLWVPALAGRRRRELLYRTTPEVNPALRRGGLMSFFRKQWPSLPA